MNGADEKRKDDTDEGDRGDGRGQEKKRIKCSPLTGVEGGECTRVHAPWSFRRVAAA